MSARPLPLDALPAGSWAGVRGVFTDIDDTLTSGGALDPSALDALWALRRAGLPVIAVTGRPAGWSEPAALHWPVEAVVAENGAVALWREHPAGSSVQHENAPNPPTDAPGQLSKIYQTEPGVRQRQYLRLQQVAARVLREVPGAALARDSAGRETDIAIDHAEHARLNARQIGRVLDILRAEGLNASVSSIHINAWFGAHDKWQGASWYLRARWGRALAAEQARWLFIGDSSNDQAMFQRFTHSVGVANVRRFLARMAHRPAHVTRQERGAGFAEMAARLLRERQAAAGAVLE